MRRHPSRNLEAVVAQRRRHGFNLAELLFAITAISALSVMAMTIVGLLMSAEQRSAEELWVDVTVAGLAADLRVDAHEALNVEVTDGEDNRVSQLTFVQAEGRRVTYECTADSVIRSEQQDGKLLRTEAFRLAFGSSRFEPQEDDKLIVWTHDREIPSIGGFTQPSPGEGRPIRSFEIVAAAGLHAETAEEVQE